MARLLRKWSGTGDITQGVIWQQLLAFFFPILMGTFFQQLYNTVDAMIVGNYVGKEALAAVGGTTSVLISFLVGMFMGVSSGAAVVISQYFGARHYENVRKSILTSLALAIAAGAGITVIGLALASAALEAMGTPADILPHAVTYMRIYFVGTVASCVYNMGAGILRAMGDSRRPLYFLICGCLTNIALDLVFVAMLGWGVAGVAVATIISQAVSAVLVLASLLHRDILYGFKVSELRFTPDILKNIIRIGLPAGIQSDMYSISNIIIQASINSFGTNTVAAYTAEGKVDGFFWMVLGAFGMSITTFVGQNFGARKYDRMRKGVRVCMVMASVTTVLIGVLFYVFAGPLIGLFSTDAQVLAEGADILRFFAPSYITFVCIEILSGAIRGTGDSLVPMLLTCGGVCVFRVAWVYLVMPMHHTFVTLMWSYPASWVITSALFIIYYFKGGWLERRGAAAGHGDGDVESRY